MYDLVVTRKINIDIGALSKYLGCAVIPLVSTKAEGIGELKNTIDLPNSCSVEALVEYPTIFLRQLELLSHAIPDTLAVQQRRWLAIQMLEGDIYCLSKVSHAIALLPEVKETLKQSLKEDPALIIADARYQTITKICTLVSNTNNVQPDQLTEKLDRVVLNRILGLPIFLMVVYMMFFLAINIGGALQPFFDISSAAIFIQGTQWLGYTFNFPEWLTIFLAQGLGGGVNAIMPFIPQIAMMYFFLSFLEDSGYMARAAFVIDRLMQVLGLPGKSFIPLIVGFGCNIPAIMGARTIETPRDRLTTILMAPFMSCGARLAIFAVFASLFFGKQGALIVFSLYILGIVVAILTALLLKYTLMRAEPAPFIMELPVYHVPHIKSLLIQTWQRLKGFVIRAGKVIILVSIFIGILNTFSFNGQVVDNVNESALASVSKEMTPLLKPMGVHNENWQATVALLTGAMAKEVVIGTLNTLYTAEQITSEPFEPATFSLIHEIGMALKETWQGLVDTFSFSVLSNPLEASRADGELEESIESVMAAKFGSVSAVYAFLIFVLLYVPCIATMGAIARESSYGWMFFSILWGLNVAYSVATLFYQIVNFSSHPQYSAITIITVLGFNIMVLIFMRYALNRKVINVSTFLSSNHGSSCH